MEITFYLFFKQNKAKQNKKILKIYSSKLREMQEKKITIS